MKTAWGTSVTAMMMATRWRMLRITAPVTAIPARSIPMKTAWVTPVMTTMTTMACPMWWTTAHSSPIRASWILTGMAGGMPAILTTMEMVSMTRVIIAGSFPTRRR